MTTVALGRGLSVLINPADIAAVADGVLVNAVWAVGQMVARPRASRRTSAGMDLAGWMDTERLTREDLPGARLKLPRLTEAEASELKTVLKRDEAQGALQALLAVRLTDSALSDPGRRGAEESQFLERYRRQVREKHGKIEPPDFERPRRVPIDKIYVNTAVYDYGDNRVEFGWHPAGQSS